MSRRKEWEGFGTYSCMLLPLCPVWCRDIEDSLDTEAAADSAGWQELQKDPAIHATCHHFPAGTPDQWPVDNKDTCTHLTASNKSLKKNYYQRSNNFNKRLIFWKWKRLRADHVTLDFISILLKIQIYMIFLCWKAIINHHCFLFFIKCFRWLLNWFSMEGHVWPCSFI